MTYWLRKNSYWASYNVPYFKKMQEISGFNWAVKKYGNWYKWGKSPGARIFRRDQHKVSDVPTLLNLMRLKNIVVNY